MPWFPDFVGAVELARVQTRAAGLADPAGQYLEALDRGETRDLEATWPGHVVVYDPRAGEIRSHRELRRFISRNHSWFAARNTRIERVASSSADGRAVLELLAHLRDEDGQELAWPVAVVAESPDDLSVVFRTYCSQWPVARQRPVRPPILPPGGAHLSDVVASYNAALERGDVEAVVNTFAPDGYYREPMATSPVHRGTAELRSFFAAQLRDGGTAVEPCAVTDDGERLALEYNCTRRGGHAVPAQAGLSVFERGPDGQLAAVRDYDDITAFPGPA